MTALNEDIYPKLVRVFTTEALPKTLLTSLSLDLTHSAGPNFIDVVFYQREDLDLIKELGFEYETLVSDLVLQEAQFNAENETFAATNTSSLLPSGRTSYRSLADYNNEMFALAEEYPSLAKVFTLYPESLEGRVIYGIEISKNVGLSDDGRPVFLMEGLTHAREWPGGELTLEFAYELLNGYKNKNTRVLNLLNKGRIVIIPVMNPDGFNRSFRDAQKIDLATIDSLAHEETDGYFFLNRDEGFFAAVATPGEAYKRKNARMVDGKPGSRCIPSTGTGIAHFGIDLNRNYPAYWGESTASTGATDVGLTPIKLGILDQAYRGPHPESEPETKAFTNYAKSKQIIVEISNHTYGGFFGTPDTLHPETLAPDGKPIGLAPDLPLMKSLNDKMAAQVGYQSISAWELYPLTGVTFQWLYYGLGTFAFGTEIGYTGFHPVYSDVVDQYIGVGDFAGKGLRESFFLGLEAAIDPSTHSIIEGKAAPNTILRLKRRGDMTYYDGDTKGTVEEIAETIMVVPSSGQFEWHINPSTRPLVKSRQLLVLAESPLQEQIYEDTIPAGIEGEPEGRKEQEYITQNPETYLLGVSLTWTEPYDLDFYIYRQESDGSRTLLTTGGASNFIVDASNPEQIPATEDTVLQATGPATYIIEVVNYLGGPTNYKLVVKEYSVQEELLEVVPELVEKWNLTYERDGEVQNQLSFSIDRGQKIKIRPCLFEDSSD